MNEERALPAEPQSHEAPSPEPQEPASGEGPRVITLGWQLPVLLVVGLGVVAVGYVLGRGGPAAATVPVGEGAPVVQVLPNATAEFLLEQAQANPFGDGPMPLPERYHPLTDTKAPDFQMQVLNSPDKVKLSDYEGQAVLVNFWATWCPPCRLEMPWLLNVYEKYKEKGFVVLGVDAGEKVPADLVEPTVRQYVEASGLTFPILLDPSTLQLQSSWAVSGLPASFLINPKGTIAYIHTGMFPNEATLDELVQKILPGGEWADQAPVGAAQ